uniref:Tripartite motif-containing protein 16-like n=1 Tax=Sinocyclocheilus grahami TaxID=75366 RepID=A0A672Q3Q7_SINGR
MAVSSVSLAQDEFSCSICLDLLKDPVTIPCGHSYCMSCITGCWDQDDQKGVYRCPQCRQTFTPRPVLGKNTMLAEVLEKLKKTKLQATRPAQCYVASGDVECDVCTGRKYKAIKSCLVCLNSYCQNHLEQHENLFKCKRHNLMDATGQLQEMICPQHEKLLEIFCRTDQQCICYLCTMDEHKNHETVSAAAERTEKQSQLNERQSKFRQRIQERQNELEELREIIESHKRSAQAAVEDSERIFTELIRSIERSCSEVTQLIRDQEKAAVSRSEGHLEQLRQEIEDLRRRDAELEQLSHTDNHIRFFQITVGSRWMKTQCINTSFDSLTQVLCRESVCGRCYWEVEWSGRGVCISVSYKSISRKGRGDECAFGYNDQSWSLYCFPSSYCKYSFCHNYTETELTEVSISSRIGVYVDHSAGTLSFYSVSDTRTLIHRVHTTFTQPLYAGFRVYGSVKLCDITK